VFSVGVRDCCAGQLTYRVKLLVVSDCEVVASTTLPMCCINAHSKTLVHAPGYCSQSQRSWIAP
jgi:hypothetical protein